MPYLANRLHYDMLVDKNKQTTSFINVRVAFHFIRQDLTGKHLVVAIVMYLEWKSLPTIHV